MSISADLIKDFEESSQFLAGNPQECNQEYFNKGSVVTFNSVTEKTLTTHCANILDPHNETEGVTLTTKGNIDSNEINTTDWKCFEKDTVLFALTPCKIKCIPHTNRKEWATIKDYNNLGDFTLNISTGDAVLMAYSVPWFLKEGRVKAFTVTKKQKTPVSKEITKKTVVLSSFKECADKHAELKARIAKLDQRVWNDKGTNTATVKKYEETLKEGSSKDLIKKYANSLLTLEARIVAAENDTSLPPLLKSLEESKALLDSLSNIQGGGGSASLKKSLASCQKKYDDLIKPQLNLVGRAKEIHELLEKLKLLAHSSSSSSSSSKTNNNASGGGGGEAVLEIPQVEVGLLTPYEISHAEGPDGYMAVVQSIVKPGKDFATMTQALKNPQVTALYEKYIEQRDLVGTQTQLARRDPSLTVNVTLFAAYKDALQKVYEDTKAMKANAKGGEGGGGGVKAPAKTIKCDSCERRVRAFEGSNLCRDCWSHDKLEPILEGLEERADYLSRKLNKEAAKQGGDEEVEETPLQKVYNEYVDLAEELSIAHDAFRVPNSPLAAWDKLKALIAKADELLPKKPGTNAEGEDDEEDLFDPDEEAEFVDHSDESSSKSTKSKKRSISEEDEDEDEEEGDNTLAHNTLLTLHRFPVQTVRENLLEAYYKGQYTWVEEELKRLEDIKEIYGFEVIELYKEDGVTKRGEPE